MTERRPTRGAAHELERYAGLFSARTRVMRSSAMRDLMAVTVRPEVISLAGGLPDTSTFDPALFVQLMSEMAPAAALQYGPSEGLEGVREAIALVMAAEDMHVDPDEVIVTTGGQQAIDLVTKTLVDPGDVVIAEAPTYPGAVPTFCSYEADVIQIEMDSDGMIIASLEETLARLDAQGRRPKFIYTIPNFQNPAGVTMSLERRRRLVEIARERELLVLEDNPYGMLRFEGEGLPTLRTIEGPTGAPGENDFVIYAGTMSKILSPGVRVGWLVAPRPLLAKLVLGKQSTDLCSSTLAQHFVAAYFASTDWRPYVESLCDLYHRRRDVILDALAENLPPEATWTRPHGGLFIWVTLPDYIDTTDMLARALADNVAFVPGEAAFADGRGRHSMRLNFSSSSDEDIREGVRRIGKIIAEQLALYDTLTGRRRQPPAAPVVVAEPEIEAPAPAAADDGEGMAHILQLPRRGAMGGRRSREA
ncbi:MAG TPA: PLP-dependent aminotransferase family protein [Solirubrobacteraceae bacterium]|jgi:2-aminoadipate transaminase|nr:PLP-dependent aminotransferase family protein [Solirubrobacteraceae bacterium]